MNDCELRALLDDLTSTHFAADEMSRLVVTRLANRQIAHRPMLGHVSCQGKTLSPHFWVEVGDYLIDYCVRRDLPTAKSLLPGGVMLRSAVESCYQGQEIVIDALPDYLYELAFKTPEAAKAA